MIRGKHRKWVTSCVAVVVAWFALVAIPVSATAAAVEVNSADQSQLETVKGIGPSLSAKILAARKQGGFKDWSDLQTRVSGIGEKNSAGFSRNGLTVGGRAMEGAQASGDAVHGPKTGTRPGTKKPAVDGSGSPIASNKKTS